MKAIRFEDRTDVFFEHNALVSTQMTAHQYNKNQQCERSNH